MAEAFGVAGHNIGDGASVRAATRVNAEQAPKKVDVQADPTAISGKADATGAR